MDSKNQLKDLLKNLKCVICHDVLIDATVINCGHSFCRLCITKWFDEQHIMLENGDKNIEKCPMCNVEILTEQPNHMLKNHIEEMCGLLLSETEKSEREETIKNHHEEWYNLYVAEKELERQNAINEATTDAPATAPAHLVYPSTSVVIIQENIDAEIERAAIARAANAGVANARAVGTGAPSVCTPVTAPAQLVYPPHSGNTVEISIEIIDIDNSDTESYDNLVEIIDIDNSDTESYDNLGDVNPDSFSAPANEGMAHYRETIFSQNLSSANDIENNFITVETSWNFRDIQAQMRADNRRYQEMEQYQSNESTWDMPSPDSTGQDTDIILNLSPGEGFEIL
jgi:hypothetical protein